MNKSLVMCGVAALALASCTQNEVLEVNDSRAIGFDAFVNKTTRAVNDLQNQNFKKFFIFGDYDDGASVAYSNTGVNSGKVYWTPEKLAYWMDGKVYTFGAYANGAEPMEAKLETVEFKNGALTITDYNVTDKDLIAGVTEDVNAPSGETNQHVQLSFKHLLSKIKFTFTTDAEPAAYRMEVSNLHIAEAMKDKTSVTVGSTGITTDWSGELNGIYKVKTLNDFAVPENSASTEENYVIPQSNASLNATFTVTVYDEATDAEITKGNFTASLATGDANKWVNGYIYNYKAKINPDKVDPEKPLKPIVFTVDKIEDWQPDTDVPTEPTTPQP